ncbi:hypothetical protein J1N35_036922 [Gossypium stocksii]|uniref:Uncharacterized protein n=1 Tax=Gossypium stocksii TaxID=47602 RepID=A0A9D3UJ76_9ROSI|nr:hypothetical protein J1N35_036922 [Gossypium stocksii]
MLKSLCSNPGVRSLALVALLLSIAFFVHLLCYFLMAIARSADSDSVESSGTVFYEDWVITSFPQHDIVKLDEGSYIQWQQQIRFILCGYDQESLALLAASGSPISEAERTAVLLAGLSSEFDAVVSYASLSSVPVPFQRIVDALLECEARYRYGHLAQYCYYRYNRDAPSSLDNPVEPRGGSMTGAIEGTWEIENRPIGYGQNWGFNGQNCGSQFQQNNMGDVGGPRGPHAGYRPYSFGLDGSGQHNVHGPNSYGAYGHVDGNFMGHPYYGSKARGPSGSARPSLNGNQISPGPTVNYANIESSLKPNAPEAPWSTKPRARVFNVDSSSYDSSQFMGIPPRLPELHASDYSDATAYDSNFNTTDLFVPVEGTTWCPNSGATHHVSHLI